MALTCALSCACSAKRPSPATKVKVDDATQPLAEVTPVRGLRSLRCHEQLCSLVAADQVLQLSIDTMETVETQEPPPEPPSPWVEAANRPTLDEAWNQRSQNLWRSAFQVAIPAPGGGLFKHHRGTTPGTSRVARIGGRVMTARQGLDAETPGYPWTLALHPTGTEAYHIVWPNPDLIAFNTRTLETSWRIRMGGPALGLFVTGRGRYMVVEIGAPAPPDRLLDYAPTRRSSPPSEDPFGDPAWPSIERPLAERTALVDLRQGQAVAVVPGHFIGLYHEGDVTLIAGSGGVAKATWSDR